MRSRTLWFLLLLIGIGLLVLVLRHDAGTVGGLETGDFASLIYKIALLVFIGGAVLALFRERIAEAFQAAMFWVVIGLLLAFFCGEPSQTAALSLKTRCRVSIGAGPAYVPSSNHGRDVCQLALHQSLHHRSAIGAVPRLRPHAERDRPMGLDG